jgi:hypothetical protein
MKRISSILKIAVLVIIIAGTNFLLIRTCTQQNQSGIDAENPSHYLLENETISLQITKTGGMFTSFILKNNPVNPFKWALTPEQMPENNQPHVFAGHFLCTGRWGEPSAGEIAAGIPHNGEVNTQPWEMINDGEQVYDMKKFSFTCNAPIEKLDVERNIFIPHSGSWFLVKEQFTNNLPVARLNNVVQHGTLAAPYLTENTIINTNAQQGFDQRTPFHLLEDSAFVWPKAVLATGTTVDLRNPSTHEGFVTTHLFPKNDEYGWITAINKEKNLLMGYIFSITDYPWFNYWHEYKDGKPWVRGLEFGTAGMGKPYDVLLEENVLFFGNPSWDYMDAGEKQEKWWVGFQIGLNGPAITTDSVSINENGIMITLLNSSNQQQTYNLASAHLKDLIEQ